MEYGYRNRDPSRRIVGIGIVLVLHLLVFWLVVTGTARKGLKLLKIPMAATVIQEVIIPPPPPPPPPVVKEIHKPVTDAPRSEAPLPFVPVPDVVAQVTSASTIASIATPPPVPVVIAPPPAPQVDDTAKVKAQIASLEGEYIGKVRAMLNSTKRYPTGRQASQQRPQGKTKLWFTITRHGALVDVGIMESSNSNLLDDAALATVRRGTYEAFPPNTWVGEEQHTFSTEIAFSPPGS
jgi:protein TonB